MKSKTWLLICLIILIMLIGCISYSIIRMQVIASDNLAIRMTEEAPILIDVSSRLEVDESWLAVREEVYCHILKEGLTRHEMESELSKVGKIRKISPGPNSQVDFENEVLNYYLGPIMIIFDSSGKLKLWGSQIEKPKFYVTKASCE